MKFIETIGMQMIPTGITFRCDHCGSKFKTERGDQGFPASQTEVYCSDVIGSKAVSETTHGWNTRCPYCGHEIFLPEPEDLAAARIRAEADKAYKEIFDDDGETRNQIYKKDP